MKVIVLYDSLYGNTKTIALAIAKAFTSKDDVKTLSVDRIALKDLTRTSLLIVGSPTQGGQPKPSLQTFLNQIPAGTLKHTQVAAFDTRFKESDQNFALQLLMKTIGYAAPKITHILTDRGGILVVPPQGFIVNGKTGPLAEGELTKVTQWVTSIKSRLTTV